MSNSCLYQGWVSHARTKCNSSPIAHSFSYPVWMSLIDLLEVEEKKVPSTLFCSLTGGSALVQWRRKDHFGTDPKLSEDVKKLVYERTQVKVDKIELLTNLSFLGVYNFNPVSVYYCYVEGNLKVVVLEVSNTPWLEKRLYVLKFEGTSHELCWEKDFHVSPFMDSSHDYDWKFLSLPESGEINIQAISKRRDIKIASVDWNSPHKTAGPPIKHSSLNQKLRRQQNKEDEEEEEEEDLHFTTFVVKLKLSRVDLKSSHWTILSNPVMPLVAVLWIHIEAFRVWWRGVKYVTPPPGSRQLGFKDAFIHLLVFSIAASIRYGIILPIQFLKRLIFGGGAEKDKNRQGVTNSLEQNKLKANIQKKGENSYYYAHSKKLEENRVHGAPPKLLEKPASIPIKAIKFIPFEKFAWADGEKVVKIYITIENCDSLPDSSISFFNESPKSFAVKVQKSENFPIYGMKIDNLYGEITGGSWVKKSDKLVVSLKKSEQKKWYKLEN